MYHALLPQKTVKDLKTEYHIRFFIVFLFFISLAILVASVFLFPSYLISSMAEKATSAEAKTAEGNAGTDNAIVTADLSTTQSLLTIISSSASLPLSSVILHISSIRPKGIAITSFEAAYTGTTSSTVTIGGTAATRNDLVAFRDILEGDNNLASVEVPISDLAPSSNLQFSIQMSAVLLTPPQQL